jgi:hypothetical protein
MANERIAAIISEWKDRADAIGIYPAVQELATALERAESRYDELETRVRGLVVVHDRRGIFLPPLQGLKG